MVDSHFLDGASALTDRNAKDSCISPIGKRGLAANSLACVSGECMFDEKPMSSAGLPLTDDAPLWDSARNLNTPCDVALAYC
jgi:hypothetical protein